jgi:hypothetical protein
MDFEDTLAFMSYIYSMFALAAYAYGGYAIKVVSTGSHWSRLKQDNNIYTFRNL